MKIYYNGAIIDMPEDCLYNPFPVRKEKLMLPEDDDEDEIILDANGEDLQDSESSDNDGTSKPS